MRGRKSWPSIAGQSAETDFLVGTGTVLPVFLRSFGCAETAFFISCTSEFLLPPRRSHDPTRVWIAWEGTSIAELLLPESPAWATLPA